MAEQIESQIPITAFLKSSLVFQSHVKTAPRATTATAIQPITGIDPTSAKRLVPTPLIAVEIVPKTLASAPPSPTSSPKTESVDRTPSPPLIASKAKEAALFRSPKSSAIERTALIVSYAIRAVATATMTGATTVRLSLKPWTASRASSMADLTPSTADLSKSAALREASSELSRPVNVVIRSPISPIVPSNTSFSAFKASPNDVIAPLF